MPKSQNKTPSCLHDPAVRDGTLNENRFSREIDAEFVSRWCPDKSQAARYRFLPLGIREPGDEGNYTGEAEVEVAMVSPENLPHVDFVKRILAEPRRNRRLAIRKVPEKALLLAIDSTYRQLTFSSPALGIETADEEDSSVQHTREDETSILTEKPGEPHALSLIRGWLRDCINSLASDLHLEPELERCRARQRKDGVLARKDREISHAMFGQIVQWLKIQARMKPEEKRLPQDGSFYVTAESGRIDVRCSTLPTVYGEKFVMRFLDLDAAKKSLDTIIYAPDLRAAFRKAIRSPNGLILVTGPTGCGKTTTLQGALRELQAEHKDKKNIVTVEDPVEYRISGVNQVNVRSEIGLTFASTLSSIVRQDPDIIMIGEIRDEETAAIALQAALTGHLVLSTVHTNGALGAIARLRDFGMKEYLIGTTVRLLQAQRLVRLLCPECGTTNALSEDNVRERLAHTDLSPAGQSRWMDVLKDRPVYDARPGGCDACANTGFQGREALMEMVVVTAELRSLIENANTPVRRLWEQAAKDGFRPMVDYGPEVIAAGRTTLDEVLPLLAESDSAAMEGSETGPAAPLEQPVPSSGSNARADRERSSGVRITDTPPAAPRATPAAAEPPLRSGPNPGPRRRIIVD